LKIIFIFSNHLIFKQKESRVYGNISLNKNNLSQIVKMKIVIKSFGLKENRFYNSHISIERKTKAKQVQKIYRQKQNFSYILF